MNNIGGLCVIEGDYTCVPNPHYCSQCSCKLEQPKTIMNKELIYTIEMPNYPRKIKLSESRRAKYYKVGDDLPQYLQHNLLNGAAQYRERKKGKVGELFDTVTKEFIVKNSRVAGTPKWEVINSQKMYNGGWNPFVQGKIVNEIHKFYEPHLANLKPIEKFPLYIECEIHDLIIDPISSKTGAKWDIYNRGLIFCKVFDDCLTEHKIIPDDNINYVICPSHPIFIPLILDDFWIPTPKLVFKIYSITDANNSKTSSSNS